jgi:hypothetical protein
MVTFAEATAVRTDGAGMWAGEQIVGWDIEGNANGGVLLALAARAMAMETGRPDPLSVTAHYLRPVRVGPVTVKTDIVKSGRRLATVTAQMSQGGQPVLQLVGTFGDLATLSGPTLVTGDRPEFAPPDQCISREHSGGFTPALMDQIDVRLVPEDAGFGNGNPSGIARMRGWFRLKDNEPLDVFAVLLALDGFPPAVFNGIDPIGWVPTVELTGHVRRRPQSEWLQCQIQSRFILGGLFEEDVELWDEHGLVALGRQLAMLPLSV